MKNKMEAYTLPNRVFNSPLLEMVKYSNGNFINLIRLNKPYANGDSFAVYFSNSDKGRLFKDIVKAREYFEKYVSEYADFSVLIERIKTNNMVNPENKNKSNKIDEAKKLWEMLGDIPVNDDMEIESEFLSFPIGTDCHEIWHWFEDIYNLSVAEDLMYNS